MIGGYIYNKIDADIEHRLEKRMKGLFDKIIVWENGFLFFDHPFEDVQTPHLVSDELAVLSQDLLVKKGSDGEYDLLDLEKEFSDTFMKMGLEALNTVASNFRMAIVSRKNGKNVLFLVSNRAGSGRIFYHKLRSGLLFCSDLRFLLKIVELDVNKMGIYSILKYGAIPEPMTVSNNISAVPPGHYVKYDLQNDNYTTIPYFKFEFSDRDNKDSEPIYDTILEPTKDILRRSSRFLNKYQPAILLSGGIDSSLYASYLFEAGKENLQAFYCAFDEKDPELQYSKDIAERLNANLKIAIMKDGEALNIIDAVVQLTDHPFADFSSLPIVFLLKYIRENTEGSNLIIECNGGDDCFGFPALALKRKNFIKHHFPRSLKNLTVSYFKRSAYWRWESHEGFLARISAIADVHEVSPLNYFLVQAPINFLRKGVFRKWDKELHGIMEGVFSGCSEEHERLSYEAEITIRQLIHINSRLWAAKALSVGESLGLKLIYPYIWREVLIEQGKLPWNAKIHNGIVKWPLKKLLEEFMPHEFIYREKSGFVPPFARWLTYRDFNHKLRDILLAQKGYVAEIASPAILDELLSDALNGKKLRFPVLNFLWAAVFTEMWIQKYRENE